MPNTTSPNMSLILPTVGQEPSPTWAQDLNSSLTLIDQHNHATGNGVPVSPSGLNINADLPFMNNNAITLRSVRFTAQGAPLALVSDVGCLYESGVDLYYNDGSGNQIRLTQSGSVVGSSGTITGLTPPASASYSSVSGTFVFQSAVNTAANIDGASILIRDMTANSYAVTINAPSALAANYSLTLPAANPGSTSFLTVSSTGNIAASISTVAGITSSNIAANTITGQSGSNIHSATIDGSNLVSNIALPGNAITSLFSSDSRMIVTTNAASSDFSTNMCIAAAAFDATGAGISGQGVTCNKTGTGQYSLGFVNVFSTALSIAATIYENSAGFATVNNSAGGAGCVVFTFSGTAVPTDLAFSIIAVGQR